ncbi:Uma2 family endonuclease [Microbispora bryophytorum]|uniref:Uma2 family endonuclease n=1 Tax=Microbispora bryophytorum subsp. camponoti TaxID=1677852 RepID=A0ABR8L5G4_9ACTN|nr:Uma2 family endonuclease [Microbispora camponoti]MBD3144902.1 Uma2 family endonuclease [Microbispora camponoti]
MALTKPTKHGRHDHPVPHKRDDPVPDDLVSDEHEPPEAVQPESLEDQLLRLCLALNEAGYRAEIHNGQVVVSPAANMQHEVILDRLSNLLYPLKLPNRWRFFYNWGVHIPPQPDLRLPDLMVVPDKADAFDDMRAHGRGLLLVVEVCSPGTYRVDWKEKPLDYARAGVPLFLIVDPVASPRRVTLMSDPLADLKPFDYHRQAYRQIVTAEEGEVLELPEPFGIKIETSALFDQVVSPPEPAE